MPGDSVSRPTTVIGTFEDRDALERALEELRKAGFRDDQSGVAMRGLTEATGKGSEQFEDIDWATQSILTVRVEGRHQEAEEILRRNGATGISWSHSLTASIAGNTDEIVDSGSSPEDRTA